MSTAFQALGAAIFLSLPGLISIAAEPATGSSSENEAAPVRAFRNFEKKSSPGLPQSTISALLQDESGLLWIATLDGLATFDGNRIVPVAEAPDAPVFGALFSLAERHRGGLYVGGNAEVYIFDGRIWSRLDAPGGSVSLAEDSDDRLWRIDRRGGVWLLGEDGSWRTPDDLPELEAGVAIHRRHDGSLWLAGRRTVFRRAQGRWQAIAAGQAPPSRITAFFPADDGTCWIGTESGELFYADNEARAWTGVPLPSWQGGWIRALEQDRRGRIWAGGNAGGVAFGGKHEPWTIWDTDNGLHREGCLAILADREGTLWLAINGHGLQQWIGEPWSHRNLWLSEDRLERRLPVFGITETAEGRLLIAVFNRGLWVWDGSEMRQLGRANGITEDVRSAVEPEPGVIWLGARFGIFESRDGAPFRKILSLPRGFVYGFYRSPGGRWHATTSTSGIYRLENGAWLPAEDLNRALPDTNVRDLLWRRESGELWVATLGGLAAFDREARRLDLPQALVDDAPAAVNALLESSSGELWIGGFGGILRRRGEEVDRFTVDGGLPGHTIYSLAEAADGAIWTGGSAGVARYAEERWQRYSSHNGLIEDECNHLGLLPRADGSVWVGTMASLAHFDAEIEPLTRPPLILRWRETPALDDAGIARLPAAQRSLRLAWQAPWLAPQPVEFRTRVVQRGNAWSPPQQTTIASFEALGPGDWTVEVAARFEGEETWTDPISLSVHIAPWAWETWWFRALCGALLIFAVIGLIRWRTHRLAARAAELELAVQKSLARIKVLGGLLPICASCKKVRNDTGYWQQLENYIQEHSEAEFSHGFCPECFDKLYAHYPTEAVTEPAGSRAVQNDD